jgi:aromatic-L-amino-acid decarboxylase
MLEVMSSAQLGVLCFRAHPAGLDDATALDAFNERVNAVMNANGKFLISSTRLRGTFTMRLCILGFRTTAEDVAALIREVASCAAMASTATAATATATATARSFTAKDAKAAKDYD